MTVTTAASSYETSIPALARLETDILGHLKSLGCDAGTLSGAERLELLHETFRPDDRFTFSYGDLLGSGLTTKSFIAPSYFEFPDNKPYFQFGDYYGQVVFLRDYPTEQSDQFVTKLTDLPIDMNVSVHITNVDQGQALEYVRRQIAFMEMEATEKQSAANQGGRNPELALPMETRRSYEEAVKLLAQLEEQNQKMFKVNVLVLELEIYIEGNLSIFADHTNVDTNKRFLVYDIRDLGKQLRTFGMVVVMDQIWNRITRNRAIGRHTWLYIDEMQLLFSNEFSANYFFELWSRSRKWGAIPTGITQNVETLLLSDLARRMLSNSRFILMFNQATSDRVELANLLNISNRQLDYVTNADSGQGLLFAGKSIVPFINNVPKNTKLYQMMTTKLEEVAPSSGKSESSSPEG